LPASVVAAAFRAKATTFAIGAHYTPFRPRPNSFSSPFYPQPYPQAPKKRAAHRAAHTQQVIVRSD
jgi:hypothetical protein